MDFLVSQARPAIDFATLELLPYGIIVLDRFGTILYYNRREEEIAQRSRVDVLGKNFFTEVAPCTQLTEFSRRFAETLEADGLTAELNFHFPFESVPRDVQVAMTSFRYGDQTLCLVSIRDLTEERDVRDHVRGRERLSELGEIAAGVAHNFNNVLTAIRVWSEVLARQHPQGSPSAEAVANLLHAVDSGTRMVESIRAGVRDPAVAGELSEAVDVVTIANSAAGVASARIRGRDVRVERDLAPTPLVRGNATEIEEVLVNLLANAIDAVERSGAVTIRTSADARSVIVEVSDTGIGMSEDVLRKLFRPLFTTKGESGTGLGLSTSYAIVRRHGGEIRVRSTVGKGTTFILTLPQAR